jgi:sigma-B regulation protein RsbU (phosphoserine phosphatase)
MLGAFARWSAAEAVTDLQPHDALVLYSDGVTEAANERLDEFGEDRLIRAMRDHQSESAEGLVHAIVERVIEFSHGSRSDDVTVVGLRGI